MAITKVTPVRNEVGRVRFFRYGSVVTNWEIKHEIPGRLRIRNPVIHRKVDLCQAIERELMSVLGVDSYKTNALTSTVLVQYDPKELTRDQIIEIIDGALATADHPARKDRPDLHLPLCTISVPFAAAAQFAAPGLLPAAAVLFAYTSIPTFKSAREVLVEEKRLGVDVLDAIVVVGCLATMSIFPGAVLCWCLGFGRVLVQKTQDNSKKLLLNAFGKQPRFVWLYRDGVEVQVSLDRLAAGDIIVVNTGEVVPVDGVIAEGLAMIDQHALTGESTPAEKGVGDRVFASTLLVAGKILVSVEKSGSDTASAKISQILNDTAGYKLSSQHKGELLADKAVIPTLTIGAVGMATMGPYGAVAVLNSDFGTGHPDGRPAGHALLAGPLRQQGHPGQGRPGPRADERDRHRPLRQDRHAHPRTSRGRPRHRRAGTFARGDPPLRRRRREEVPSPDRPGDPPQGQGEQPRAADHRRHPVQGGLRHHRAHPWQDHPRRQQAVHGARGPADGRGDQACAGRSPRAKAILWSWSASMARSAGPSSCTRPSAPRSATSSRG